MGRIDIETQFDTLLVRLVSFPIREENLIDIRVYSPLLSLPSKPPSFEKKFQGLDFWSA